MTGICIRPANADDAAGFPAIERSAAQAFLSVAGLEWIAGEAVMSAEQHRVHIDAGTVWLAETDGRNIGFVTAAIYEETLHIVELSVADGHQGRGVGRRLLEAAAEYARDNGLAALTLTTFRDLPFNETFYQKLGYRTLNETEMPKRLADILEAEIENGLPGNRRCAMRLML
ncbi:GNAT family N-acetyltransferase [Sphingorhabdus sp. YGSMI21]|uniref:GNAT family N-acetyltransferase n=1 Tax=Sphingorhabdus sp. YGSMI21 TaxID=2077182 RepID=UPI000C1DD560|nr:GNAT family N-acetyltransferase [Sphingorhabdus sp. YGSMI21]ATW03166.1 hypothetical protein CHN51_06130 [Sphingorhabdus sp. YGSMI21]